MSNSGANSKRPSPPSGYAISAAKRMRNDDNDTLRTSASEGGGSGSAGNSTPHSSHASAIDPDKLSDALLSAGVDLKEEENLLSSTLSVNTHRMSVVGTGGGVIGGIGGMGAAGLTGGGGVGLIQQPPLVQSPFLEPKNLQASVKKATSEMGVRYSLEKDKDNEIVSLLSASCEEWLSNIVTDAIALSRHRRRSRNDVHSNISRALRNIAIKDKEREEQVTAHKVALGLVSDPTADDKKQESEDTQHRAANATALMMTSGRKKYSWMTGGSSTPSNARTAAGASRSRSETSLRYREAREEPGLAVRDLLGALEEKRFGVENAIVKGYAKLKN